VALVNNKAVVGTTSSRLYDVNIDNFGSFSQIKSFLFLPLHDKKGQRLGVLQFYNYKIGNIDDKVIVSV